MQMRVLLALGEATYRDEVAATFEGHRPHFRVRMVDPKDTTLEEGRFRPHLIAHDGAKGLLVPPARGPGYRCSAGRRSLPTRW